MPIVTFTSKREAEILAKKMGGSVVELVETGYVGNVIYEQIRGAYDDGFKLGYEQAKAEDKRHA